MMLFRIHNVFVEKFPSLVLSVNSQQYNERANEVMRARFLITKVDDGGGSYMRELRFIG